MLIALLKKDWRLYRVPVIGSIILIGMPYLLASASFLWFNPGPQGKGPLYQVTTHSGLIMTVIMAAVFGGTAFAYERRERWADFLGMCPVSRLQIVASKVIVSAAFLSFTTKVLLWINVVLGSAWGRPSTSDFSDYGFALFASCMLMSFGVAWLCSTFLSSPSIATCFSVALLAFALFWPSLFHRHTLDDLTSAQVLIPAVTGIVSFLVGTIYYLRRIAP